MKGISFVAVLATSVFVHANSTTPKVIYGDDNRSDVYATSRDDYKELADSTVAMLPTWYMSEEGANYKLKTQTLGTDRNLCQEEKFYSQPTVAKCSGFLVGEDLVATAAHCINVATCPSNAFVFGFKMKSANESITEIPKDEVYKCKEIVKIQLTNMQDYALVRLERPVRGHKPLALSEQPAQFNDEIFVIGHPSGLPTKISDNAKVRKLENGYFVANLDTFGGNSGSAVFDTKTNKVLGILVRGETDYEVDSSRKCQKSKKCAPDLCRGEDITNISFIINALNNSN